MSLRNLADDLRSRNSEPSLDDQITVLSIHYWVGTHPDEPYLTKRDLSDLIDDLPVSVNHNLGTVVSNLEDKEVLNGFQPKDNPEWYVKRQRDDKFVMGDKFDPAVREERERIIEHIQSMDPSPDEKPTAVADGGTSVKTNSDGETLREVVADEFGTPPSELESHLRNGDYRDQRERINTVVDVVKSSDTFAKPDNYDEISLIPSANRYHLTSDVIRDYGL